MYDNKESRQLRITDFSVPAFQNAVPESFDSSAGATADGGQALASGPQTLSLTPQRYPSADEALR
jgi:hypothetical protein